jgi:hypothetical protein
MTTARQKELIEEYVAGLPSLPHGCLRPTQPVDHSATRDQRVRSAPSEVFPSLTAVHLNVRTLPARSRVLDYKGWILTEQEYMRFGYAVHTAVHLPLLFDDSAVKYVLLGDPTMPAAQINCVTGTGKTANVQLTLSSAKPIKKAVDGMCVPDSHLAVRAKRTLRAGQELWLDYGRAYWQHMSVYCPHCLEYAADEQDQMLLCDVEGCKRAWHQLCMAPCLVEVPDGPFYCDIHSNHGNF